MRPFPAAAPMLALVLALSPLPAAAQDATVYPLGPNDQIEVSIFGGGDKVVRTRIKADGTITLPFIGTTNARGLSTSDLAQAIAAKLKAGGVFQNPIVNVEVTEYVSREVTVLGQVGTPGMYPLDRPQTVASILARAGGVRSGSANELVTVRRGDVVTRIPIARAAQERGRDMALLPGDVLYVGDADQFYIYGQVNTPGAFEVRPGMTLRQALARGGGPTLAGTEKRVSLYRGGQQQKNTELDELVQPGDVLMVGEKTF